MDESEVADRDTCENWPYPCDCFYCENRRRAAELAEDLPALRAVPTGMEAFVLVRDECLALANHLTLAMVDGYSGSELAELHRRCSSLAGSLWLFVGHADRAELQAGVVRNIVGTLTSELERERREISRLRDELVTAQHETDLASERVCAVQRSAERKIAELKCELERLRAELARP